MLKSSQDLWIEPTAPLGDAAEDAGAFGGVCGPVLAVLASRLPHRSVLVLLMAIFILGNVLSALSSGFALVLAARQSHRIGVRGKARMALIALAWFAGYVIYRSQIDPAAAYIESTAGFVGGLGLLLAGVLIFVLALVLLGYLISTMARTQMQAMQLTFFFFLPSLMLSGFMFPYRGMPGWAQALGEIFPLTHFLRLIRSVMLKGADVHTVAQSLLALTVFVLVLSLAALMRFRRTLD